MGGEGNTGRRGDIRSQRTGMIPCVSSQNFIRLRTFSGSRSIWVGNNQDFSGPISSKYMRSRARALIGLGWRGAQTEIMFSTCLSAHANHRITRNPSTDGTMRAGLRAVVTVRRESARATPIFRKKLQLRRVQRSRLNGRDARLSDLEAELEQLATDARRSPQRIFCAHLPDQRALIGTRPSNQKAHCALS